MIQSLKGTQIHFCKSKKGCCPTVQKTEDGNFLIGGEEEGFSTFTKINMIDFINAAKEGKFDNLIQ